MADFDLSLPEGCPKKNFEIFTGTAYRIVLTDPPTNDDLLTYLELNKALTSNECKRGSVSLFSTALKAKHCIDMSPRLGKFVASITLTEEHGVASKPSPHGHIDWWPYAGMRKPHELKVVAK